MAHIPNWYHLRSYCWLIFDWLQKCCSIAINCGHHRYTMRCTKSMPKPKPKPMPNAKLFNSNRRNRFDQAQFNDSNNMQSDGYLLHNTCWSSQPLSICITNLNQFMECVYFIIWTIQLRGTNEHTMHNI